MRLTVNADEVEIGDTVLGIHGREPYVYPLEVGTITDFRRGGVRLGPRLYSVTPKLRAHQDFRWNTRLEILRRVW